MTDRAAPLHVIKTKPRVFVTSDIGNEPDDSQSLVRYLLYSNEFRTEGLVACTSTHQRTSTRSDLMHVTLHGYAQVVENLNAHAPPGYPYPDAQTLFNLVQSGPPVYGREALRQGDALAEGTKLLINALDASDEPLWVLCWGGSNVIAQALQHVKQTRSEDKLDELTSKLRIYMISDQDDTGPWIRLNFPHIFLICSVHGWGQYRTATWWGITCPEEGAVDKTLFSLDWLKANIQLGALGRTYPDPAWQIEGDTPSFLYLIPNGLGAPDHPSWGSWGGRYEPVDPTFQVNHYADTVDTVIRKDQEKKKYCSNFATVWRWAEAFQNDFAARMQWSLHSDFTQANHAPVAIVNGDMNVSASLYIEAEAGQVVSLDASESYDHDGDILSYSWFHYKEPTMAMGVWDLLIPEMDIVSVDRDVNGRRVEISMPPAEKCAVDFKTGQPQEKGHVYHFILEVKDDGTPALTSYKRVVIQIVNKELRGTQPPWPAVRDWEPK